MDLTLNVRYLRMLTRCMLGALLLQVVTWAVLTYRFDQRLQKLEVLEGVVMSTQVDVTAPDTSATTVSYEAPQPEPASSMAPAPSYWSCAECGDAQVTWTFTPNHWLGGCRSTHRSPIE